MAAAFRESVRHAQARTQLGKERAHVFYRKLLLGAADTPLLRGLVQSVPCVAVRDPGLYLPWVSKGFELMFRESDGGASPSAVWGSRS